MLCLSVPARMVELSKCQRTGALKYSIPAGLVNRVLEQVRFGARACPVTPDFMAVWLVIGLGLYGTDSLRQIWRNFVVGSRKLKVPARNTLCMARQRIGVRIMIKLAKAVLLPLADLSTEGCSYKGMPLRAADICNLSLYDSPANRAVFSPVGRKKSRGKKARRKPARRKSTGGKKTRPKSRKHKKCPPPAFPQGRLCCLCEVGTHAMLDWTLKPMYWADCKMAPPLLRRLQKGQLLLWDSAFYSRENLELVLKKRANLLGRLSWSLKPRKIRTLSDGSYLAQLRHKHKVDGPVVRIIDYTLKGLSTKRHKHRLMTTLLDEVKHPSMELAELYHSRWELESAFDELETHQMQQRILVSQTPAGVVQEVAGMLIAHWMIRKLMFQASVKAGVAPIRISFTSTLKILRCRLSEAGRTAAEIRSWHKALVAEVAEEVLEPRRRRVNPRVLKRTTFDFPKKRNRQYGPQPPPPQFQETFAIIR